MVPTLGIPNGSLEYHGYLEGYSIDQFRTEQYENAVYLLFKPENIQAFHIFLRSEYIRTTRLIDDYDYAGGFIVLVYLLETEYAKDFALIREGKYSKTSKPFQERFVKEIRPTDVHLMEESLQHRVFKKDKKLRMLISSRIGIRIPAKAEVWEIFGTERETLNFTQWKTY